MFHFRFPELNENLFIYFSLPVILIICDFNHLPCLQELKVHGRFVNVPNSSTSPSALSAATPTFSMDPLELCKVEGGDQEIEEGSGYTRLFFATC
ncbi:MAG: hypothetical protein HC929_18620 [Leptolyngbyaceae cyanobacterium SM2_5_2]|nr:hypothetical protein [Leptolyngbyaceae cyanobacterium SM2_5_2]